MLRESNRDANCLVPNAKGPLQGCLEVALDRSDELCSVVSSLERKLDWVTMRKDQNPSTASPSPKERDPGCCPAEEVVENLPATLESLIVRVNILIEQCRV